MDHNAAPASVEHTTVLYLQADGPNSPRNLPKAQGFFRLKRVPSSVIQEAAKLQPSNLMAEVSRISCNPKR